MVKKKSKPNKKTQIKGEHTTEDVTVNISLPPQVEGQLRCYVKLSVNQIVWMVPNSPDETHVRIQWWGEDLPGSIFRPADVKKNAENADTTLRTTARYPIRSGPKQFAAYLNDMGTLVLEVLSGAMQVPVGRALVENITQLSPSRPINGFFPVLSADGAKVAELQVSVVLESLMASYDSAMSSVPTPDMSLDFYHQTNAGNEIQPHNVPHTRVIAPTAPTHPSVYSAQEDPFKSPVNYKSGGRMTGVDNQRHGGYNHLRDSIQSYGSSHRANTDPTTSDRESQPTVRSSTTPPQYPSISSSHPSITPLQNASAESSNPYHVPRNLTSVQQYYPSSGAGNLPKYSTSNGVMSHGGIQQPAQYGVPVPSFGLPLPVPNRKPENPNSDSQGTLNGLSTLETLVGGSSAKSSNSHTPREISAPTSSNPTSDLVSVLLERGNRLKEAMIKSTLPNNGTQTLFEEPSMELNGYGSIFSPVKPDTSTGDIFREILSEIKPGNRAKMATQLMESYEGTMDEKAVDLVMGANMTQQQYKMYKALTGSPTSSVSGDDDIQSDMGDPLHDDQLLQDLFYKQGSDDDTEIDLELYTANSERGNTSHYRMSRSDLHRASQVNDRKLNGSSRSIERGLNKGKSASLASLEEDGNMRTLSRGGSRHSSMSSLLLDTPNTTPKKKKTKKARSRSNSVDSIKRLRKNSIADKVTKRLTAGISGISHRSTSGGGHRSRSRTRGGGSQSDSELMETSRVSFDPVASDTDDRKVKKKVKKKKKLSHSRSRSPPKNSNVKSSPGLDGLSIQRLTLLGRVQLARVVIDKVKLDDDFTITSTPVKAKIRGKPPRPVVKKDKCTYFVEYNFPVVATTRDKFRNNTMATEVMRVASKKVKDGEVSFAHRSVFPVLFDAEAIDKWWKSALVVKVYCRSPSQKVPRMLGMCSLPLKTILKSEALYLDTVLEIKDRSRTGSRSRSQDRSLNTTSRSLDEDFARVGTLKVNIELASDSKEFSTMLAKTRLAEMNNPKIIPVTLEARVSTKPNLMSTLEKGSGVMSGTQTEPRPTDISDLPHFIHQETRPRTGAPHGLPPTGLGVPSGLPPSGANTMVYQNTADFNQGTMESLTLHTLLLVPEGQNITQQGTATYKHGDKNPSLPPNPITGWAGRDGSTRNLYLNCRMFWCDDVARSAVCWGTFEPAFNFVQVAPVLLTGSLLERMRNNFMVIEVWDKKTSSENDQLVGIVKLPLHQLYMSFRDRKIANSLLRSQYPVVSIDSDLAIHNPFSGKAFGQIKVLLAMGSLEQITNLQNVKLGLQSGNVAPDRPMHYLERQDVYSQGANNQQLYSQQLQEHVVEHQFEISVENMNGLRLMENMIWGEADCFVQYHFPAQTQLKLQGVADIAHATPSLKTFRTATTLCVPDPVFNDLTRHRISLPEGTPVQRELLTACAGAGGGAGGIPFEVWNRCYHPNVRDQVIAKTTLPLARLCAMVTMQKRGEASVQTFSLPLRSLVLPTGGEGAQEEDQEHNSPRDTGMLEVTITYTSKLLALETDPSGSALTRNQPTQTVCISLGVVRASGLKSASVALARHDAGMQYASEVGVNSYVRVKLSFLPKEDERITRTVARSFAPDFSYYLDFPCPLLWTEVGSDALSLAEILETAEVTLELWHQVPGLSTDLDKQYSGARGGEVSGRRIVTTSGDIMLGTVTVPLVGLLTRKTGLNGWFPVHIPNVGWETGDNNCSENISMHGSHGLERVVGGLEISLKFAHHEDFDKVVHAGRGVGWSPDFDVEHIDWESADEMSDHQHQVILAVDMTSFPLQNALHVGQNKLTDTAHCYIRYKFFDRGARCSKLCKLQLNEEDYLVADINSTKEYAVPASSPFTWYLHEELLEIQVWVTYHTDEGTKQRPRNRDKLIGSAYINLAPLSDSRRRQHRISNLYPLYKPGASNLGGAFLRAHMTVKANVAGGLSDSDESDGIYSPRNRRTPNTSLLRSPRKKSPKHIDSERCFAAHISIDRAFHLPIITEGGESLAPNGYVSYQTAESSDLTCTNIFPRSSNPVWNHEHDTYLGRELLTTPERHLVFKVWHNIYDQLSNPNKGADKVLGFVSVDLMPLVTSGFNQICGWYNIMDFNGSCQGQVKVSITPQENLASTVQVPTQPPGKDTTFGNLFHTTQLPHFNIHYESVKKHHRQLTDKMQEMGVSDPSTASRSLLFNSLRNNMDELDTITSKLKERLHVTPFSQSQPSIRVNNQSENTLQPVKFNQTEPLLSKVETFNTQGTLSSDYYQDSALENTDQYYHSNDNNNGYLNAAQQYVNTLETNTDIPQYHRTENDNSCYSETLRNAQDTLSTAQNLIANLNQVSEHLQDQLGSSTSSKQQVGQYNPDLISESHGHHNGYNDKHGGDVNAISSSTPVSSSMHVHFSSAKPTVHSTTSSGELPNTSQNVYTSSGILSEAINHREVFERGNQDDDAVTSGKDWREYNQSHQDNYQQNHNQSEEDEEEVNQSEDEVVMKPKPLNDVSSANFANYASLHENQAAEMQQQRGNHSAIAEEQDSWFSGAHNTSRPDEFYDTIDDDNKAPVTETSGGVDDILKKYGHNPQDYNPDVQDNSDDGNDDGGIEEDGRHVYAFQSLASKYQVESDDNDESVDLNALLKHNKPYVDNEELDLELAENPSRYKQVSRTSHDSTTTATTSRKSSRKAAEFRHKYNHQRHTMGSSDSEEEQGEASEHTQRQARKKPSSKQQHVQNKAATQEPQHRSKSPEISQRTNEVELDSEEDTDDVVIENEEHDAKNYPGMSGTNTQFNPMLRTQKTIQIVWDGDKKVKQATGVDFDERSTPTYRSSQESEQEQIDLDQVAEQKQHSEQSDEEETGEMFDPLTTQASTVDSGAAGEAEHYGGFHDYQDPGDLIKESQGFAVYKSDDLGAQGDEQEESQITERSAEGSQHTHSHNNANGNNNGHVTQSDVSFLKSSAEPSPRVLTDAKTMVSSKMVPNFFLPPQDLEVTMKALRLASTAARNNSSMADDTVKEKSAAKHEMRTRLSGVPTRITNASARSKVVSVKSRPKPSTEQAQRIAKIFQQKFGSS